MNTNTTQSRPGMITGNVLVETCCTLYTGRLSFAEKPNQDFFPGYDIHLGLEGGRRFGTREWKRLAFPDIYLSPDSYRIFHLDGDLDSVRERIEKDGYMSPELKSRLRELSRDDLIQEGSR